LGVPFTKTIDRYSARGAPSSHGEIRVFRVIPQDWLALSRSRLGGQGIDVQATVPARGRCWSYQNRDETTHPSPLGNVELATRSRSPEIQRSPYRSLTRPSISPRRRSRHVRRSTSS